MIPLTDDISNGYNMRLNFIHPEKMQYDIDFVGRVLGRTGRFNNISDRYYSVAEHCYHASYLYPKNSLGALMHDAPEAFTGDITTHLKSLLRDFKEIEHRIEADMVRRFGYIQPEADFKADVDTMLFFKEEEALFSDCHRRGVLPDLELRFWPADYAGQQFIRRFWELKDEEDS